MNVPWKQYEGQVINNTFPLLRYLGGSGESAVFLTKLAGPQSSNAAIKLIPESSSGDLQLSLWRRAAQVTHPNLLRLYQGGSCRLANLDLFYVVMEYAEEDLSQVLPQRALTPQEAREMLGPVMDALSDLHSQGLVHTHLKPSNILATADQVKLSSDRLAPAGANPRSFGTIDVYDAPESIHQAVTPTCDVWSLGMTIVEVLTQYPPQWQPGGPADPLVPNTLPQPFLNIAQNSLRQNPAHRWTLAQVRASLNPAAAAAAAQAMSPLSIPLSPVAPVPAAKLPLPTPRPSPPPIAKAPEARQRPPIPKAPPSRPRPRPAETDESESIVLPSYIVPLIAALLIVAAIIALPRVLNKRTETSPPASTAEAANSSAEQPAEQPARSSASRSAKSNSPSGNHDAGKSAGEKPAKADAVAPSASPAPAALRSETKAAANASKSSRSSASHGEVLDQVLPDVSEKALSTIRGTVRVSVRLHVDAAGNVANAEFADPGPSQYFADLALKAARKWEFTSPDGGGRSVPSEWQVRFEFSPAGIKAFPSQTSP